MIADTVRALGLRVSPVVLSFVAPRSLWATFFDDTLATEKIRVAARMKWFAIALVLGASVISSRCKAGYTSYDNNLYVYGETDGGNDDSDTYDQTGLGLSYSHDFHSSLTGDSYSGEANLHVSAYAKGPAIGFQFYGDTSATNGKYIGALVHDVGGDAYTDVQAQWADVAYWDSKTLPEGTRLEVYAQLNIHGTISSAPNATDDNFAPNGDAFSGAADSMFMQIDTSLGIANPNPYTDTRISSQPFFAYVVNSSVPGRTDDRYLPGKSVPFIFAVSVGEPYLFGYGITMRSNAGADAIYDYISNQSTIAVDAFNYDYSNTITWGGIDQVVDVDDGNTPVTDWSVTSDSGVDYSRAYVVSEPSGMCLIALLAVVVACGRLPKGENGASVINESLVIA